MQLRRSLAATATAAFFAAIVALLVVTPVKAQLINIDLGGVELAPALERQLETAGDSTPVTAVLAYDEMPAAGEVEKLEQRGLAVKEFDELPMLGVEGTPSQMEQALSNGGMEAAYPNKKLDLLLDESRPLVGADEVARDLGYTGEGVGVAVIDSGIDGLNQDVRFPERTVQNNKIVGVPGTEFGTVDLENLPSTATTSGHGTHVAGVVGGDGSNSDGRYTGMAPGSDLIGVGAGDGISVLYALEGFDYILENQNKHNIQVVNNSYGTTGKFDPNSPMNMATREAYDCGITVVFAAGNSGPQEGTLNPFSVAPWVIGVASGQKDGETLSEFSSRGTPAGNSPTLTAPGSGIVSARASTGVTESAIAAPDDVGNISPTLLPFYTTLSGTSFASPHVAGTVALMEEANPSLTPDQAKRILANTATPMAAADHEAGSGYLDARSAVEAAEASR